MSRDVILLNGVGSAGKSSIARALQALLPRPFLHVAMDDFLEMLPARYMDHPDGLVFETLVEDGQPSVAIHSGAVTERALAGMRGAVAALAEAGNDLIVDEVLFGEGEAAADYRRLLAGHRLRWVAVMAPLPVLEQREAARGDRMPGLARWQFDRVHAGLRYDLTVDSSQLTPEQCAQRIVEAFGL